MHYTSTADPNVVWVPGAKVKEGPHDAVPEKSESPCRDLRDEDAHLACGSVNAARRRPGASVPGTIIYNDAHRSLVMMLWHSRQRSLEI